MKLKDRIKHLKGEKKKKNEEFALEREQLLKMIKKLKVNEEKNQIEADRKEKQIFEIRRDFNQLHEQHQKLTNAYRKMQEENEMIKESLKLSEQKLNRFLTQDQGYASLRANQRSQSPYNNTQAEFNRLSQMTSFVNQIMKELQVD